jgi:hypothetical protein
MTTYTACDVAMKLLSENDDLCKDDNTTNDVKPECCDQHDKGYACLSECSCSEMKKALKEQTNGIENPDKCHHKDHKNDPICVETNSHNKKVAHWNGKSGRTDINLMVRDLVAGMELDNCKASVYNERSGLGPDSPYYWNRVNIPKIQGELLTAVAENMTPEETSIMTDVKIAIIGALVIGVVYYLYRGSHKASSSSDDA